MEYLTLDTRRSRQNVPKPVLNYALVRHLSVTWTKPGLGSERVWDFILNGNLVFH